MPNIKSITTKIIEPSDTTIGGTIYKVILENDYEMNLQIETAGET